MGWSPVAPALTPHQALPVNAPLGRYPVGRHGRALALQRELFAPRIVKRDLGKSVRSRNNRHMLGMMRDSWWWPWWVSTLIDVGVVVLALILLRRTSRRYLRAAAALVALAGVVAAVMAPIVMTDKPNHMTPAPMMP